jgi:hypothetical protein
MATHRQRRAAAIIVESRGTKPISRAMREAGYPETTAKNPKNLTESDGYKEALADFGLTEQFVTKALVSDIKAKPKRRARELELAADILSMTGRNQKEGNKTLIVVVSGESAQRYGVHPTHHTEASSS